MTSGTPQDPTTHTRESIIESLTAPGGAFELVEDTDFRGQPVRRYATGPVTLRDVLISTRAFDD